MASRLILPSAFVLLCMLKCAGQEAATRTESSRYVDFVMRHDGVIERGKALFQSEQKALCSNCHTVDGTSGKAGPDLAFIGDKFPRRELITTVLEPSASIAVGYEAITVTTKSDEEFSGTLRQATETYVELMGWDGKLVRVPRSEIATQRTSNVSFMPEGLQGGLSEQEFADLIEYLVSLKQPESSLTSNRGMPSISNLTKPVGLRPFISEAMRFPHSVVEQGRGVRSGLTWFGQIPGITNAFLATHELGQIWLLEQNGTNITKTLFADLSLEIFSQRGPNGLLSLAFHPRFAQNRKYYLNHQILEDNKIVSTVVEREAAADLRKDAGRPSRLVWRAPTVTQNHTGGGIQFGPDGFLYIGSGDTGPQGDPQGHGQDLTLQLGKMLRIDVDHQSPGLGYAIPADNPFCGRTDACPEIWAYGFREPWRFSFDPVTSDLWVGDVGQDRVEEVGIVRRGENHGWNVYEGFEPFSNRYRRDGDKYIPPVFAYARKYGFSVTGGFVYRGNKDSSFYGVYICGDYVSKRILGLKQSDRSLQVVRQIGMCPESISSFGTDEQGSLYVVGYEGMIYKLDLERAVFE